MKKSPINRKKKDKEICRRRDKRAHDLHLQSKFLYREGLLKYLAQDKNKKCKINENIELNLQFDSLDTWEFYISVNNSIIRDNSLVLEDIWEDSENYQQWDIDIIIQKKNFQTNLYRIQKSIYL